MNDDEAGKFAAGAENAGNERDMQSKRTAHGEASFAAWMEERDDLRRKLQASQEVAKRLQQFESLREAGHLIALDYALRPHVRYGHGRPLHPRLACMIAKGEDRYREHIAGFLRFAPHLARIAARSDSSDEPFWINGWIPAFDAISIYGFIALRNPRLYLEIGSGSSTRFARRAIRDHGLRTRIVSVDPMPRAGIDSLCDEIVRQPLEEANQSLFASLGAGDMVFYDGSHYCFQNSDTTVFFTEVLPAIAPGVLIGVHDIFLPHDYPHEWLTRYYNEQYLLACYLLAGDALSIELPTFYCAHRQELHRILDSLWQSPALNGTAHAGGAFWCTTRQFAANA